MPRNRIILAIGIAAIVIVVGIFGYLTWKKSPRYSLNQVRHAFETHDLMKFEKYVDTETLVTRFVDQTLAEHMEEQQANDAAGEWGMNLAQGIIQAMKPQLVSTVEQQIKSLVEQGSDAASEAVEDDAAVNLAAFFKENEETNLDFEGVEGTKKDGKIATVTLAFYQPRTKDELKLEVKMRQMDGYWQVAELPNATAFIEQTNAIREKILAEKNQPIVAEIQKALIVQSARKYERSDSWGIERNAVFDVVLKNIGTKDIKTINGLITAKDKDGNTIKSITFADDEGVAAGQETTGSWYFATNQFIDEEKRLYETPNEDMQIDVSLQKIVFSDGSELKLFE